MNRQIHYGLTATAIVSILATAWPADAQRRGGGGGGAARASTSISRPAGGGMSAGNRANTGNVNAGNKVNTGNINAGNKVNTGDINVNVDRNWNGNVHVSQPIYGTVRPIAPVYHPVAAGVVIGTTAAVTAAAIGSMYYALPPSGCRPYPYSTYTYYYCGSVYYKPQYQGDTVVYVVVSKPG